jgi:ComF family protein
VQLAARLLDWIFPDGCAACDAPAADPPFCGPCADSLMPVVVACPACGAPGEDFGKPRRCAHCRERAPPFARASSPYLHGGALMEAIHRLKYEPREDLARTLGVLFAACEPPRTDVVAPIPLHAGRLRERGYDQARLLAAQAARRFGLPVMDVLQRVRPTPRQVGLDRSAREKNLHGAFRSLRACNGLRVCLIDDVMTTGATAAAAAQSLLDAGAARVEVRTLARAP